MILLPDLEDDHPNDLEIENCREGSSILVKGKTISLAKIRRSREN